MHGSHRSSCLPQHTIRSCSSGSHSPTLICAGGWLGLTCPQNVRSPSTYLPHRRARWTFISTGLTSACPFSVADVPCLPAVGTTAERFSSGLKRRLSFPILTAQGAAQACCRPAAQVALGRSGGPRRARRQSSRAREKKESRLGPTAPRHVRGMSGHRRATIGG